MVQDAFPKGEMCEREKNMFTELAKYFIFISVRSALNYVVPTGVTKT